MTNLQVRYVFSSVRGEWEDLRLPWASPAPLSVWGIEIREKPEFVPGWFQDYSMEYAWEDRGEQGPIRWFDWDHNLSGNKWRRVEVKILDDPNEG